LRGVRTSGPMAPEISLEQQRPAQFVFSRHVDKMLNEIHTAKSETEAVPPSAKPPQPEIPAAAG
jgi:hypothetical protein